MTQHAPPAPFQDRPWHQASAALPAQAAAVPTMLTEEEGNLLYWLARDYATGDGTICDLGCFAGGSTARLASGVAAAGRNGIVHAFDHFTLTDAQKERYLYPAGISPFGGKDMQDAVGQLLAPWRDHVNLRPGDITKSDWRDGPIELLFIDAAKSPAAGDRIAEIFMPHLIPGRSVVIQQDYLHWRQPWVAAQMEMMTDCMQVVGWCQRNTVIFLVTQEVSRAQLRAAATRNLTDEQMIELLGRALVKFPERPQRAHLARAIMGLRDNPNVRAPHLMNGDAFNSGRVNETIQEMREKIA